MASYVAFKILAAGKSAISFVPAGFLSQFSNASPGRDHLPSPRDARFHAAAEDCGYGDKKRYRVRMTSHERSELLKYLRRQGRQVRSLFKVAPSMPLGAQSVTLKSFAKSLHSNEKGSLGYVLGSIYSRVATERWHAHPARATGGPPRRYWHFSIAGHSAVQLVGLLKHHDKDSPDYIVEDAKGNWSAVEAKGSLGKFDNSNACAGMEQAHKFDWVAFLCPISHAIHVHPIGDRVCVYTFVDASNELQVVHIDPPGGPSAGDAEWGGDLIIAEAADLVRLDEAMVQYSSLVGRIPHDGPYRAEEIIWAPSRHADGNDYGVLGVQATMWPLVRRAIAILEFITPWISMTRRFAVETGDPYFRLGTFDGFLRNVDQAGGGSLSEDPELAGAQITAAHVLFDEMKGVDGPLMWQIALNMLWSSDLLSSSSDQSPKLPKGIHQLWEAVSVPVMETIQRHHHSQLLDERLPGGSVIQFAELAASSHGLFVRVPAEGRDRRVEGGRLVG